MEEQTKSVSGPLVAAVATRAGQSLGKAQAPYMTQMPGSDRVRHSFLISCNHTLNIPINSFSD